MVSVVGMSYKRKTQKWLEFEKKTKVAVVVSTHPGDDPSLDEMPAGANGPTCRR
jgi:hypothetical protein